MDTIDKSILKDFYRELNELDQDLISLGTNPISDMGIFIVDLGKIGPKISSMRQHLRNILLEMKYEV